MKCSVLSWNVRCLGSLGKRTLVKELAGRYKPDITILQETKLERVDKEIVKSLCHFARVNWAALPSVGTAGGIVILWNEDTANHEDTWIGTFSVSLVLAVSGENQRWILTGVYNPSSGNLLDFFCLSYNLLEAGGSCLGA